MFKDRFVQLLQEKDITGYKLAKMTGLSQGLISDYKSGRSVPSAKASLKIAEALGISVDELFGKQTPQDPPTPEEENAFAQLFSELTAEEQMEIVQRMLEMRNKK